MTKAEQTNKQTNKLHVELYKVNYDGGLVDPLSFIVFGILGDKPILEMNIRLQVGESYSALYDFAEAYGCLYLHNAHGGKQRANFNPEEVTFAYEAVKNGQNSKLIASNTCGERDYYGFIPGEVKKDCRVEALANIVFMRWAAPVKLLNVAKKGLFKNTGSDLISVSTYLYTHCPNDKGFYNKKFCEQCNNSECLAKAYFSSNYERTSELFCYDFASEEYEEELDELKGLLDKLRNTVNSKSSAS